MLLESRQQLLEEARKKVDEGGYSYKKGKSRSKSFTPTSDETPKRSVTTESIRQTRIVQLQEDIKDISDRLQYKMNRRDQAGAVHNYKLCDQLMEEITHLKHRRREYESELKMYDRKSKKSQWFKRKKKTPPLSRTLSSHYSSSSAESSTPSHSVSAPPRDLVSSPSCEDRSQSETPIVIPGDCEGQSTPVSLSSSEVLSDSPPVPEDIVNSEHSSCLSPSPTQPSTHSFL